MDVAPVQVHTMFLVGANGISLLVGTEVVVEVEAQTCMGELDLFDPLAGVFTKQ